MSAAITIIAVIIGVLLHVSFPTHMPTGEVDLSSKLEEAELLSQPYL